MLNVSVESKASALCALFLDNKDVRRLRKAVKRATPAKGSGSKPLEIGTVQRSKAENLPCMDIQDGDAIQGTLNWFTAMHFNKAGT